MATDLILALDASEALEFLADEAKRIRRAVEDAATGSSFAADSAWIRCDAWVAAQGLREAEEIIDFACRRFRAIRKKIGTEKVVHDGLGTREGPA